MIMSDRVLCFIKAIANAEESGPEGLSYDMAELYEEGVQDGMTRLAKSILSMMKENP